MAQEQQLPLASAESEDRYTASTRRIVLEGPEFMMHIKSIAHIFGPETTFIVVHRDIK